MRTRVHTGYTSGHAPVQLPCTHTQILVHFASEAPMLEVRPLVLLGPVQALSLPRRLPTGPLSLGIRAAPRGFTGP